MLTSSLEKLEEILGYHFTNPHLLLEAITHSSFAQESSASGRDNEQLEFLGDAVLNFLVSVRLADAFPDSTEGKLSRARARLVAATHLSEVAMRIGLGAYLRLGRGEEKSGGRKKSNLLVAALEALLAALYRDGGLDVARRFVDRFVIPEDVAVCGDELFSTDYKSALQEYLQAERLGPAQYRVAEEAGPEHQKTFTIEVTAGKTAKARGSGPSKKAAEQEAARALLRQLGRRKVHG
jgi:ribonuclease-3